MLLNRSRRGGHIPRRQLENRFRRFQEGEGIQLLSEGQECVLHKRTDRVSGRRRHRPDDVRDSFLSFAVDAVGRVVSSPTSIGGCTVGAWRSHHVESTHGPRPQAPVHRVPLSEEVATAQPVTPFELDPLEFLLCLRAARCVRDDI